MARIRSIVAAGACALAATGCGIGAGGDQGTAELRVTRDFGATLLTEARPEFREADSVIDLLDRETELETRYGGGFVHSIDGLAGEARDGRRHDWFFYVNGIESPTGAAAYDVAEGDRIHWDHRDWSSVMDVRAIVGAYPEPFIHGFQGNRWDAEVRCAAAAETCDRVARALDAAGAESVGRGDLASAPDPETIAVLVGPWRRLRADGVARLLEGPPSGTGVLARFVLGGKERGWLLEALDERARIVRSLAGAGLVAALRPRQTAPTWIVTGTDQAGLDRAVGLLSEETLRDRFAMVAPAEGVPIGVPIVSVKDGG